MSWDVESSNTLIPSGLDCWALPVYFPKVLDSLHRASSPVISLITAMEIILIGLLPYYEVNSLYCSTVVISRYIISTWLHCYHFVEDRKVYIQSHLSWLVLSGSVKSAWRQQAPVRPVRRWTTGRCNGQSDLKRDTEASWLLHAELQADAFAVIG